MKFLPLLLINLVQRHRMRTALTILSIIVAFVLFVYMTTIRKSFDMGVTTAGDKRLWIQHRTSANILLPVSYQKQIREIPGVDRAAHATWFGGVYQNPKNFFPQLAVNPPEYLPMFSEFLLPKEQYDSWMRTRTGAIAGRHIAEKYGWKVGDKIPILTSLWPGKNGDQVWTFDLVGIYDGRYRESDRTQFLFRYDYFDENRVTGNGTANWFLATVHDPKQAEAVGRAIDEHFANSSYETRTQTDSTLRKNFAHQVGDFGAITTAILSAVFFTILLVAGNTMAQSVRERVSELAVMKAVGFTDGQVLGFIMSESLLIAIVGGAIGLTAGWLSVAAGDPTGVLPYFFFPNDQVVKGVFIALLLGALAGLLPALQGMRLNTVDALRRE